MTILDVNEGQERSNNTVDTDHTTTHEHITITETRGAVEDRVNIIGLTVDESSRTIPVIIDVQDFVVEDTVQISSVKAVPDTILRMAPPPQHDMNDPAFHSERKLTAHDISILIKAGPYHPSNNFSFPKSSGRSFNSDWMWKTLPDNMKKRRTWISYSVSKNRAYCLPCMMFGGPLSTHTWACHGWNDWGNGVRDIDRHEMSKEHKASEIARLHWLTGTSMNQTLRKTTHAVIEENRNVVSCVIECVKYLAQEMIGILGHNSHDGKLQNLFRLVAKYNPSASAYVERLNLARESGKKVAINFLSPSNTQRLLSIMKGYIVEQIVRNIRDQKKCSIIADGTYDSSKKEATVLLVRYIEIGDNETPHPVERLVDVFCAGDTSGASLCEQILESLKKVDIDINWVVGQGYDGAGNVRGKYKGLKTKIQEINPKAVYI